MQDLHRMYDILKLDDEGSVSHIEWTDDGQLLGVSTPCGNLHVYLTQLPIIGASYMTRIAYLTSLQEITLQDGIQSVKLHTSNNNNNNNNNLTFEECHSAVASEALVAS